MTSGNIPSCSLFRCLDEKTENIWDTQNHNQLEYLLISYTLLILNCMTSFRCGNPETLQDTQIGWSNQKIPPLIWHFWSTQAGCSLGSWWNLTDQSFLTGQAKVGGKVGLSVKVKKLDWGKMELGSPSFSWQDTRKSPALRRVFTRALRAPIYP